MADDPVSDYCDYLDKEMTIMGLLSAFAVAVPGLVLDRTAGVEKDTGLSELWKVSYQYLIAGGISFLIAALLFYRQRSLLAYYIGQLRFSKTKARYKDMSTEGLLEEVDAWSAWVRYQSGFIFLTLGFALFFCAMVPAPTMPLDSPLTIAIGYAAAFVYGALNTYVMTRYEFNDRPWFDFFHRKRAEPSTR